MVVSTLPGHGHRTGRPCARFHTPRGPSRGEPLVHYQTIMDACEQAIIKLGLEFSVLDWYQ
eukprot:4606194-Alexandrium_andersonii.AAC.1